MILTPEQAAKVRALHAKHVSAAAKLEAADADAHALDYAEQWLNNPERERLVSRRRKAHAAFYRYIDHLGYQEAP